MAEQRSATSATVMGSIPGWVQWGLVALLTASAGNRLLQEFDRLLFQGGKAAIDVRVFSKATQGWFAGVPVYETIPSAVYPPASYLMLWPFFGGLDFTATRFLWAGVTVLFLVWLVRILVRASRVESLPFQFVVGLVPLFYACRATIGNGQLGILILPVLVTALCLFRSRTPRPGRDAIAVGLMVLALVKPNFTAPFFWIALFASGPGKWWPGFAVVGAYLGLTLVASAWQPADPIALMIDWVDRAQDGALFGSIVKEGYGSQIDLIHLLRESGLLPGFLEEALEALGSSATVVSLCMLGGLGAWVAWHRRVDLWILLGMSAIVARLWTYHHLYDDILLVLPTIALFRLAQQHRKEAPEGSSPFARGACYGALAAALFVAVVPSTVIDANTRLGAVFVAVQTSVWLAMGLVLAWEAARARGAIERAKAVAG